MSKKKTLTKVETNPIKVEKLFKYFKVFTANLIGIKFRNVIITHDYKINRPVILVDKKDLKPEEIEILNKVCTLLRFCILKLT
jgi:hypothetical protein